MIYAYDVNTGISYVLFYIAITQIIIICVYMVKMKLYSESKLKIGIIEAFRGLNGHGWERISFISQFFSTHIIHISNKCD